MCPFYIRRKHYPKLEKPAVQNIAVCENQDKQRKSSDHWKLLKTLFLKKSKRGWCKKKKKKKTERLTEIQVLTKDFASYKIRYNSLRKRK